jgi:two-component system, NarL family, sensor kinase
MLRSSWLIAIAFLLVAILDFLTPQEWIFGYLYILPLLVFNQTYRQGKILKLSIATAILTLLNLCFPIIDKISIVTLTNRLIAVMALIITGCLCDRNRYLQTEIIKQQTKLISQEQLAGMRADFISTLTHDLKTPLLGAIELLKALIAGQFGLININQKKVLATIQRSHENTINLVMTMLDIYHNDLEGLKLQCESVNLVTLAEEEITLLSDLAVTRQVYLSLNYGQSDFRRFFWVNADKFQLQRVFENLLINGINHSPRGGKIEIIMESQGDDHIVRILDNGPGIKTEQLTHLFERFYQGQSNRQAKGSGLGLYLSRQIIEAHGGIIWAENSLLQGAIFNFRLPAIPPPSN